MSTRCILADTFVKCIESLLGVDETAWGKRTAHYDAAICAVVTSIAGLEHGATDWKIGVVAYIAQLLARFAWIFWGM